MRIEEALAKHDVVVGNPLTDYERGVIVGLQMYAWMKDGVTYVGTTGRTLGDAVDRFLTEHRRGKGQ